MIAAKCASFVRGCGPRLRALADPRVMVTSAAPPGRAAALRRPSSPFAPYSDPRVRGRLVVAFSSHSREELEEVAWERFGKPYDTLSTDEKKAVGGIIGGRVRRAQLGHEGYQEMGHKGGEARKEQMVHEAYQEMGHKGGEARKEQLGHEGYQEMGHKGGEARKEQMVHEAYQEMGRKGHEARHEQGGSGGGHEGLYPEGGGRPHRHPHEEQ